MEPEGSLPHSQVPATCPYPESDHALQIINGIYLLVQGDSLARGPEVLSIKIVLLILKGDHFQHRL